MKATGVHQTVQAVSKATGKDCGCGARREKLNKFSNKIVNKLTGNGWVLKWNPLIILIGLLFLD